MLSELKKIDYLKCSLRALDINLTEKEIIIFIKLYDLILKKGGLITIEDIYYIQQFSDIAEKDVKDIKNKVQYVDYGQINFNKFEAPKIEEEVKITGAPPLKRGRKSFSNEEKEKIAILVEKGNSFIEIARNLNRSYQTIYKYIKNLNNTEFKEKIAEKRVKIDDNDTQISKFNKRFKKVNNKFDLHEPLSSEEKEEIKNKESKKEYAIYVKDLDLTFMVDHLMSEEEKESFISKKKAYVRKIINLISKKREPYYSAYRLTGNINETIQLVNLFKELK